MAKCFITYKYRLHQHYKKFQTLEEARANPPEHVESEDWKAFCGHFESEQFKVILLFLLFCKLLIII